MMIACYLTGGYCKYVRKKVNFGDFLLKPQSAKAKGRVFQQRVRDLILECFPSLTESDVRSTSMGAPGVDIQLSSAAFTKFPYKVECKSKASIAVYPWLEQHESNTGTAIVFARANHKEPIVVLYAQDFLKLIKELNEIKNNNP